MFSFDGIGELLPVIMMVVVWSIVINNTRRNRQRRQEPTDYDSQTGAERDGQADSSQSEELPQPMPVEQQETKGGRDLAAEFERKLKSKMRKPEDKGSKVITDAAAKVRREAAKPEPAYKESQPDYNKLAGSLKNIPAYAMTADEHCSVPEAHREDEAAQPRRFARPALVQGFIMSQVLDKPVGLKPYDNDLFNL